MVKKRELFLFGFVLFAAVFLAGFGSATITLTSAYLNNTDNFFSNYTGNDVINVLASVTNTSTLNVAYANFTNLTTSCGAGGLVNFTNLGGGVWNASCNVGYAAERVADFVGGPITLVFVESAAPTVDSSLSAILYNMTTPTQGTDACTRAGSKTTNFKTGVSNFSAINFIVHREMNLTCLSGGSVNAPEWRDMILLNLTSVDLSTQSKAQKLSLLSSALNVSIVPPKVFGASKININTTAFAELDTAALVTFYSLPMVYVVESSISGENIGKMNGYQPWARNGYESALGISTTNVTLVVSGFSGYNITDNNVPSIAMVTPGTATNLTSFVLNVSVNGTGTEPSRIAINVTNSTGQSNFTVYNSTINTARCTAATTGGEFYYCALNFSSLSTGNYTVNVTAWDYGGASPGNVNALSRTISVDTTAPSVGITFSHTTTTMTGTVTITEDGSGIANCVSNQGSISGSGNSWTVSHTGLTCNTSYEYNVTCTDNAGNSANVSSSHSTSACSSGSSGDGGGSDDGSSSGDFWTITYYLTDNQFKNGTTKTLKEAERIMFKINNVFHSVGVINLYTSRATINVSSDNPQQADIDVGETLKFDVTGDGFYDASVTLNNITLNSTRASFTVRAVNDSVPATTAPVTTSNQTANKNITVTTQSETASNLGATSGTSIFKKTWFWAIVVILAAGIAAGAWYYLKIRKKRGY